MVVAEDGGRLAQRLVAVLLARVEGLDSAQKAAKAIITETLPRQMEELTALQVWRARAARRLLRCPRCRCRRPCRLRW